MLLLLVVACTSPPPAGSDGSPPAPTASPSTADTGWGRGPNPHGLDDVLRWSHVQTKGTHNSYHLEPEVVLDPSHRYSHPTLTEQLDLYGVRQLELDLHLTDDEPPVWHVLHLPGIDPETTCLVLTDCLAQVKAWSDDHGWHLPVTVWLEPKDDVDGLVDGYQPIEGDALLTLDEAIRSVWPEPRLFRPDDLRGSHATLPEAVAEGWPLLGTMRGRVLFALLDSGRHRDRYLEGADVLQGRVLFVDSDDPTDPFAALFKDGSPEQNTAWAQAGFVVTDNGSRAGDDDTTAEAADQAILSAGVHHAATDLVAPQAGAYWLDLPPRCNPVSAPAACEDAEVERLDPP